LRAVTIESEGDDTPEKVRVRMRETLDTMEMFDGWYSDVSKLPRRVQMTAIKLGAKVARLLPGSGG
jgi:hypothetical protein